MTRHARRVTGVAPALLALLLAAALPSAPARAAGPTWPAGLDLAPVRSLPALHNGRWMPLDTLARDVVYQVTGAQRSQSQDAVAVLLSWTFEPTVWLHEPVIRIASAELRKELSLPTDQELYSYVELMEHGPLQAQIDGLQHVPPGRKLDALQQKVSGIATQLGVLGAALSGQVIAVIPNRTQATAPWGTLPSRGIDHPEPVPAEVAGAWTALGDAYLAQDAPAFAQAATGLSQALAALPAAHRPAADRLAVEQWYNQLRPFRWAWVAMAVGAVLSLAALFVQRVWFDRVAALGLILGFVILNYGLYLRWQVAGRIPAANMYESLLFVGWGMGVFAIIAMLALPHRLVPLSASVMGALALLLADVLPIDPFVRPIAPVLLDTFWMTVHVPVIMVSYSVLAMAVIMAHVQLGAMAVAPGRTRLHRTLDHLHYWYAMAGAVLLFAGIATGSMWAASSWGRYWGWDPKEVWSLVACLGYLAILHVRIDAAPVPRWAYGVALVLGIAVLAVITPRLGALTPIKLAALAGIVAAMLLFVLGRAGWATALKSVLAFWLIIMTYVGVNYVLGIGLHSYAFGTGAVARYVLTVGLADLLLVVGLTVVHLLRRPTPPLGNTP